MAQKNRVIHRLTGIDTPVQGQGPFVPNNPERPLFDSSLENVTNIKMEVSEYPIDLIVPDFYQSRGGILPRAIGIKLENGEVTPLEAIEQAIKQANKESPLGKKLAAIRELADDIKSNGLINPIHIYRISPEISKYRIIAGERRYWAFWLLQIETNKYSTIPAVPHAKSSDQIQISENELSSPVNTIGHARQIAKLFLALLGINPPANAPEEEEAYWDFYKQSAADPMDLTGKKKLPDGLWDNVAKATGKDPRNARRYIDLFKLPPYLLAVADEFDLGLVSLNFIGDAPEDTQLEIARITINQQLTVSEVENLVRLAKIPGRKLYNIRLEEFASEHREELVAIESPNTDKTQGPRTRRPAIEAQAIRLPDVFSSLEKATSGDYRAPARLIMGNKKEDVPALIKQLRGMADALEEEQEAADKDEVE